MVVLGFFWLLLAGLVLFGFGHGWDVVVQTVIGWLGGVISAELYRSVKKRGVTDRG